MGSKCKPVVTSMPIAEAEEACHRMCTGKLPYCERTAKQLAKQRKLRAYPCPFCHKWHLTKRHADVRVQWDG
jgi:hypothetical protein